MGASQTAKYFGKCLARKIPLLKPILGAISETAIFKRNRAVSDLPWREIPIIINSFNRYDSLNRLIEWLISAGHSQIFIIDNDSTYPPLLKYFGKLKAETRVKIIRLGGNYGHKALWERNMLTKLNINTEFVYTDPDIVPAADCPKDLVRMLRSILKEDSSIAKAGPGLRLDDIPDHFKYKKEVINWERRYWLRPAARGAFLASIDTTFALYRPHSDHELMSTAVRTGWPYLVSHEGWFMNHSAPSDEDRHYFSCAKASSSTWSTAEPAGASPRYQSNGEESSSRRTIINLGCGHDLIPGYLNLDNSDAPNLDVKFDLNTCSTNRIPLDESSVDGIYACHVIEHIRDNLSLMQELHRIAKPNAKIIIRVPYGSSNDAMEDPTHVNSYFEDSFTYFGQPAYSRADYGYHGDWEVERVILVVKRNLRHFPEKIVKKIIARTRNSVHEMIVHMRAVKPIRPRLYELYKHTTPRIVFSRFDRDSDFSKGI